MPSPLPSSFASAAAGNTQDSSTGTRRGDGIGTGEWSRSRVNGATQTFRRPSGATNSSQSQSRESNQFASSTNQTAPYIPPHLNSSFQSTSQRNGTINESRYSKEQLLGLYKSQREYDNWGKNLSDCFMADWNPRDGTPPTAAWGKKDEKENSSGPEICWDHAGQIQPLALMEMNEEEKDLFSTSVNSPLKPPPQSASKDSNNTSDRPARKSSVSHSQSHLNNYNASPTSNRTGTRRRETADSSGNPMSPSGNSRFFRDEPNTSTPPPSLLRRKTDFRDSNSDAKIGDGDDVTRDSVADTGSPFGSLKRSATNPVLGAGSSAWPSASQNSSSSFSPMGAFGSFSLGPGSTDKKSSLGTARGESRFKGLLPKDNSDDGISGSKEKSSLTGLERLPETENDEDQWGGERTKTRGVRSETNPFGEEQRSGSAALGGAQDTASGQGIDQLGFSAFGMSANNVPGFRELMQSQENSQRQTPAQPSGHEPMSPTNTNPYQSPHGERAPVEDNDREDPDMSQAHLPNLSALRDDPGMGPFGPIRRGGSALDLSAGDRSQTSSAGPGRGFSGLGGLGGMSGLGNPGGWPTSAASGTPTRERSGFPTGFGDPIFGSMGDLQSPSLSTLGGGGFFGSQGVSGTGSIGRASKMGSLFPSAMQEQMRGEQGKQDHLANEGARQQAENDARNVIGGGPFDSNFPKQGMDQNAFGGSLFGGLPGLDVGGRMMRGDESYFPGDKLNQAGNVGSGQMPISSLVGQPPSSAIGAPMEGAQPGQNLSQSSGSPSNNPLPATQQRQMVMPDRMRWIYRDPQGNTQGPWSGLEMHDWFKAGFFTAELQVKKLEDAEYEPLAQLVRRIGNSREPFLVPQIGVPHGPAPTQSTPWTGPGPAAAGASVATPQSGAAQPPFPSSFPSFGTTLTAEQQNALERRKQEEQYLMARQKEHLAQQQVMMKQMQLQGGPPSMHSHQLQHHSSAHSLHSQPSYGSITSPGGYQPSPIQGPIQPPQGGGPGFFDGPLRQNTMPNLGPQMLSDVGNRDEELPGLLERLNVNRGQAGFSAGPSFGARQQENSAHSQQVASMLQDRARLQQEQEQFDMQNQGDLMFDQQAREERLRQFHALRNEEEFGMRGQEGMQGHPTSAPPQPTGEEQRLSQENEEAAALNQSQQADNDEVLSLSQQVQKAASAQRLQQQQQQQQAPAQTESPWAKVENQPFPPPPSVSPLPAPAAQRNRQNVADALAAESRSQNQTPIETPTTSLAPWAKESTEGPKGPSLKEIQEAEARKAAQQEEIAAAARRALAEQERLNQPLPPAPGLPSSANWASGSPATPNSTAASAWTKPIASKNTTASTAAGKKTLAQIQKEEEARKQRQAAASAAQAASAPSPVSGGGKRYADLASKITPSPTATGAWTTVGAGGKAKAPPAAPAGPRSTSGTMAPATLATKPRAVPTTRPSAMGGAVSSNQNKANEEFTKWAKVALAKGLNTGINVDDFVQQLLLLPPETEIISDSVYANSQTLDGRRFADEFVRRRKLADKGVVDPVVLGAGGNGFGPASEQKAAAGGWNEVAKKGPVSSAPKDEGNAAFKVVAAKKKGKR
ncbi:hypothetical protein FQN54_004089 [Arachnomyces sp. PD_36]|nr:hypothetical protein FQN54_004089 [Arachnomyces sp. PD_36]